MNTPVHPLAPSDLPYFIPGPDGSDTMMSHMVIFLLIVTIAVGIAYLHLHAVPERLAHKKNSTQLQLIAILALLALFTHNNLFWVAAVLLAAVHPPDVVTPLNSIARSLQILATGKGRRTEAVPGSENNDSPVQEPAPAQEVDLAQASQPETAGLDSPADGDAAPAKETK